MSIVTIQEVNVEVVNNGKKSYSKAAVVFTDARGENKTKNVLSFSNPAVFSFLTDIKSPTKVQVENDGAPYFNWTKIEKVVDTQTTSDVTKAPRSTTYNDNRETSEERARRQVMIVKQSSLSNALEYMKNTNNTVFGMQDVIDIAQMMVDWVMDDGLSTLVDSD